jgi:ADP-ribose pyrophosphatase
VSDPVLMAQRTCYASPRFQLVDETFATVDGAVVRPVIHHPGAVAILAQPAPDQVLLVRQYRYPIRRWTVEIPAGTRVPGEDPAATAARELAEEAGLCAARLCEIGRFFPALGVSDEEMIVYRASGLAPAVASPDHGELVGPLPTLVADLPSLRASGELCDAKTLLVLAWLGLLSPFPTSPFG